MKKIISLFASFASLSFISLVNPVSALAHCPLCVAGAAVGLSLSQALGIDDAVTGVWMAAFLGAMSFWTTNLLLKKAQIPFGKLLIYILTFSLTIWSFYKFNLVPRFAGEVMGVHKLTFGIIAGGVIFYLVDAFNSIVIAKNKKVFFPYQRVVVSLGSILILSLTMLYLVNFTQL